MEGIPGAPPLPPEEDSPSPPPPAPGTDPDRIDRFWLERAVELGRRGWGRVHPNPLVGCVLVRDGVVVGEGWHREFGGPHAEVEALRNAGEQAAGATAYVSLEPCAHHGKTPPCTVALKSAGVRRVVFGAGDPGVGAGGGAVLREWGIEVAGPLFHRRTALRENPGFFARAEGRSHVTLKLALSLDARIARAPGERTPLTGAAAWDWVMALRAGFDGIVVGARTALVDDPRLTPRGRVVPRIPPARIVLDPEAELPTGAALLDRSDGARVLVMVARDADPDRVRGLEGRGAEVVMVQRAPGGIALPDALDCLKERGLHLLLCEGGGQVAAGLASAHALHRLHLLLAPVLLGEQGVAAFPGVGPGEDPADGWAPVSPPALLGRDVLLTYDRGD
jgi:diaminohydroxyphosphoribosylaminopyrimidine deaminase / 5-amino-6-(5-phosphoribosylamino)uracil reductase